MFSSLSIPKLSPMDLKKNHQVKKDEYFIKKRKSEIKQWA